MRPAHHCVTDRPRALHAPRRILHRSARLRHLAVERETMPMREPAGAEADFRPDVMMLALSLPLDRDAVPRRFRRSRFAEMWIEVVGDQVCVNGQPVAPCVA